MPPRSKRKRAPSDSSTTRRTRSSTGVAAVAGEEEASVRVAVTDEHIPVDASFAVQRQRGVFLDAVLAVGDTRTAAHRAVLAVCSPFLDGLFTSGLAESSQAAASSGTPVVIRDVDGAAVAACVDCMYSGSIALSGATVSAVIKAANLLQVGAIEEAACEFFVGRLEADTALDALGFAERMAAGGAHGRELREQCLAYAHENFTECVATPAFVDLLPSTVQSLIESDELCVESEEVVLSALRRWYEHDTEGRAGSLQELVPLVRFPMLPGEAKLRLPGEPLLLALSKLGSSALAFNLLVELAPEFQGSAAAVGCPRLRRRVGCGQVFTFASVDNTNAGANRGDRMTNKIGGLFDKAGVLHHIATEGGTSSYVNPHTAGRVMASRSSQSLGRKEDFVARQSPHSSFTQNVPNSWMAVDLGAGRRLTVNHYALRHGLDSGNHCLRNWELQGSEDGASWTVLRRHDNDTTMEEKGRFVAHWAVEGATTAYRHFRVQQHGANSGYPGEPGNGFNHVVCGGIELYGTLTEA
eukprot:COSAG01_NODE_1301_length_10829_cov_20.185182_4_plen_526_part_00